MKHQILTILFLFVITHTLHAQTADDLVKKAIDEENNHNYQSAMDDCNAALQKDARSTWALNTRGLVKIKLNRSAEAVEDFNQAITLDPTYKAAFNNRGIAKSFLGNYTDALTDFNSAIALDQKYVDAYLERGLAENLLEHYADAIADFDRVTALNPQYALAYYWSGYAYYLLGKTKANYRKAVADYDMAVQLGGDSYKALFQYRDISFSAISTAEGD
jgi:tetratricopeptide (TPR) repeat protein